MIEMFLQLYSFAVLTGLGVWNLQKAHTGGEMFFASLFFPLSIYLATRVFYRIGQAFVPAEHASAARRTPQQHVPHATQHTEAPQELIPELEKDHTPVDIDRRLFLKMIGSAGLGVFMMSVFTDKAHAAFFGSLPGTSAIHVKNLLGQKINPAEEHPTDGYSITEIDDASYPAYYGFLHKSGAWYITKEASDGSYRYTKGSSGFAANWLLRGSLSYGYYDTVFA